MQKRSNHCENQEMVTLFQRCRISSSDRRVSELNCEPFYRSRFGLWLWLKLGQKSRLWWCSWWEVCLKTLFFLLWTLSVFNLLQPWSYVSLSRKWVNTVKCLLWEMLWYGCLLLVAVGNAQEKIGFWGYWVVCDHAVGFAATPRLTSAHHLLRLMYRDHNTVWLCVLVEIRLSTMQSRR